MVIEVGRDGKEHLFFTIHIEQIYEDAGKEESGHDDHEDNMLLASKKRQKSINIASILL